MIIINNNNKNNNNNNKGEKTKRVRNFYESHVPH